MAITRKFPITLQERLELGEGEQRFPASFEEFKELLAVCDYQIEFQKEEIIAMSIAGDEHEQIVANLLGIFYLLFKGNPDFRRYGSNRHVFIPEHTSAFSPDASIVKGEPEIFEYALGKTANLNPWLVAEVLSESTRRRDWGEKLPQYRRITSLQYILFLEQGLPLVTIFERSHDVSRWTVQDFSGPDQSIRIADRPILIGDIYENVKFDRKA